MKFDQWWENHIEIIKTLRKDANPEWLKPIFENCWIVAADGSHDLEDEEDME